MEGSVKNQNGINQGEIDQIVTGYNLNKDALNKNL